MIRNCVSATKHKPNTYHEHLELAPDKVYDVI